jgi:hypothetical protein
MTGYQTLLQDRNYTISELQEARNMMTDKTIFRYDTAFKLIGALLMLVANCHKDFYDVAVGLYNECIRRAQLLGFPLSRAEYDLFEIPGETDE